MVLDSSALLTLLFRETGHENVNHTLTNYACHITTVNRAEVIGRLILKGIQTNTALTATNSINALIAPIDQEVADIAGMLVEHSKPYGLSLGDRICLAYAQKVNLPVLTADKVWSTLPKGILKSVDIHLVR